MPLPLPLSTILIIFIDLGFEMCMALSYSYDPPEVPGALMKLAPRKPVTETSLARLKSRAGEQCVSFKTKLIRKFEKKEEENLVDAPLLSYSYMEAGTIQTIGCLVCYFWAMYYHYDITPSQVVKYGREFVSPIPEGQLNEDIGLGGKLTVIYIFIVAFTRSS